MKSLVLGIMLASVSMSFAQSDGESTHQLKQRLKAKQMMKVQPASIEVNDKAEPITVKSRKEVKSSVASGVIRVKNGTPFIDIKTENVHRRMMPVDFPKAMAVDGQEIQFRYTVSDLPLPKHGKCSMVIDVYDIALVKKR
ncbi:MAG: hypothetical protein P8P74_10245 [Crocinitomicaceae bacterium]|nr:hypothetical protein [Crocinitomicaceae bacterium]